MFTWLRNKLASPLLPILIQTHKVALLVETTLKAVIIYLVDGGVLKGSPIYNNIDKVLNAVTIVNEALSKIIAALGGTPITAQALKDTTYNLDSEIEKLKNLL